MQVMIIGANELIKWIENVCRFTISEISKQYKECGGMLRGISVPGRWA
jgi:hypothetical protein